MKTFACSSIEPSVRRMAPTAFEALYTKWFGEFNDNARAFFLWNTPTP